MLSYNTYDYGVDFTSYVYLDCSCGGAGKPSNIVFNTPKIRINVQNPSYTLDVNGNGHFSSNLVVGGVSCTKTVSLNGAYGNYLFTDVGSNDYSCPVNATNITALAGMTGLFLMSVAYLLDGTTTYACSTFITLHNGVVNYATPLIGDSCLWFVYSSNTLKLHNKLGDK